MIAVDSNLLVYAHREENEFHETAKEVIDALRHEIAAWAIPWPCIHEVISITTHPKVFRRPSTLTEVFAFIETLMDAPQLQLLAESPGYFEKLKEISTRAFQ